MHVLACSCCHRFYVLVAYTATFSLLTLALGTVVLLVHEINTYLLVRKCFLLVNSYHVKSLLAFLENGVGWTVSAIKNVIFASRGY